ncbi:unnamed protein product [Cyclocybe aegerita]|uniref:Uncharacterized protein n=1 Tax=Cyclocybe aegerita TaxID=1973307 RepID=A0A8S0X4C1_CYCAE|nr:unnamed protein product [Cyclocybe aegerita]
MSVADVQPTADPDDAWSATWGALYSTAPTTTVVGQQRQQFAPRKSAPPTTTPMVSAQVLVPHGAVSAGPNVGIGPANVRTGPLVTPASTPSPTLRSQAPQWGLHQPGGPVGSQPPLSQAPAIRQPYAVRDPWLAHAHVNRIAYQPAPSSSTTAAAASAASALATLPPAATAPSPSVTTFSTLPPAAAPNNQTDPAGSAGQKRARTNEDPTEDEGQSDVARRPRSFFPDGRPNHPDNSFNSRG